MKFTKLLSIILAITMLLGVLCACQPADKTPSVIDPPTSDTETQSTDTSTTSGTTPDDSSHNETTKPDDTVVPDPLDPDSIQVKDLHHSLFNGVDAYIIVNQGKPFFTQDEITTKSFETYAELDSLGRCGVTFACVGKDLMPTEDRESISSVYPSGWKYNGKSNNKQYDFVDGKYIYNRCHLIGFQLTGENANKQNLITGTRYLNIDGMLTFENMVADAVRENNLHVMYRVTPIYEGNNLVPEGVLIEGYSVEDEGETIEFCFFSFNVQPGIYINYATGENWLIDSPVQPGPDEDNSDNAGVQDYILNTNSKKFHSPDCSSAEKISDHNKEERTCNREELIAEGYSPCGYCKP